MENRKQGAIQETSNGSYIKWSGKTSVNKRHEDKKVAQQGEGATALQARGKINRCKKSRGEKVLEEGQYG